MIKQSFHPVSPRVNFPDLEERMLQYWKDKKIFEKSIASRPKEKTWTFLDGPPFITGLPHYGTLLSSIPKDVFPRFWTMKGYRVRRVWGWDCHGLPAENKVEEKLKIKRKRDIEERIGIKKFINECKLYVKDVSGEWEWYVDHIARWVDFQNAYKTMDLSYMETVMWVFKQLYDKGHIYKGLRVSLYCPHCATPISNFEVAMDAENYVSLAEPTAVYMYPVEKEKNTYLLAWSTTPWNKIATPALAVNPSLAYVTVQQGDKHYILAKAAVKMLKGKYRVIHEYLGHALVGKTFTPHYDYYEVEKGKRAFVVVPGDFVTAQEGTGIVTIAAYGEEDLAVMVKENIHIEMHVDDEGMLKENVPRWGGSYYLDVDPLVIDDLTRRGLIYRVDSFTHTVPTCWRCHTRLLYAPQDAWYVNIQQLKDRLRKTNAAVNWFPKHFKYGRYAKSLEHAPDWCISRSRYWGSPVPVWECDSCGERFVPGSIAELEKVSGKTITDLHKPGIDQITVRCKKCGRTVRRVPEVLDSWIEAGSASLAERHFPFEQEAPLEEFFPPDFIVEYTGQIRAWFYVLHVIATALFDSHAFKHVVVTGVILGTDARKMSKNYGNYPDPKEMLTTYGGDALRLYLLGSPVMHGEDIRISKEQYRLQVRGMMLILWNVYTFFVTYANVDGWQGKEKSENVLDAWILSLLQKLIHHVTEALEGFDTVKAVEALNAFISDLSTWYIRRSRDRVGPTVAKSSDKQAFYTTCFEVLTTLTKLMAPFTPFLAEEIYRNLTGEESVHLASWPVRQNELIQEDLEKDMMLVRKNVEVAHSQRKAAGIKLRQPLLSLTSVTPGWTGKENLIALMIDELNLKHVDIRSGPSFSVTLDRTITPELKAQGDARELVRTLQMLRKEKGCRIDQRIRVQVPHAYQALSEELLSWVKGETLANEILWGDSFDVLTGSTSSFS